MLAGGDGVCYARRKRLRRQKTLLSVAESNREPLFAAGRHDRLFSVPGKTEQGAGGSRRMQGGEELWRRIKFTRLTISPGSLA